MRNLGFRERASREAAVPRVLQACRRESVTLDRIAWVLVELPAQVEARQRQLPSAEAGVSAAASSCSRNTDRIRHAPGLPREVWQSLPAWPGAGREYLRGVTDDKEAQIQLRLQLLI
jgi:hypothetical protein